MPTGKEAQPLVSAGDKGDDGQPMKLMAIGFPKSGTTTLTNALEASGLKCAHWIDAQTRPIGNLIYRAVLNGLDPLAFVESYDAITQADICKPELEENYWPNLDFSVLLAIRRFHPECLFLLNYRRPEAICDSIMNWFDLHERLVQSEIPGLPKGWGRRREHLLRWIENHFEACRTTFANDKHFLEIDIERPDAPDLLGTALGIPIVGWGNHKPITREQANAEFKAAMEAKR